MRLMASEFISTCKNCNKIYVGETERSLQLRVTEHQKYAKDPKKSAVDINWSAVM